MVKDFVSNFQHFGDNKQLYDVVPQSMRNTSGSKERKQKSIAQQEQKGLLDGLGMTEINLY
jgi:hypothetical protein